MHPNQHLIDLALAEDIGTGDITTDSLVDPKAAGTGVIVAKEVLVVAGLEMAQRVFSTLDAGIQCRTERCDGDTIGAGEVLMTLEGRMASLLKGERTALNFLQRLSGIATGTRRFLDRLGTSGCRLVDTRKTTPGWRVLEKYAVRVGGAGNHRMGLFDGVLIKDNHIAACGGVAPAVARARRSVSHMVKIEVEVSTFEELEQALAARADIIMLDNMALDDIRDAVARVGGRALVEVSGGVTADRLAKLAETGVDLISCGALTHSAVAVDISMRIAPAEAS
jgi:nicotinate-nucleotide pyrophosphorylase (carboxylating)